MTDHEEMMQGPDFKDCKTGLVVFGILQIILGGVCALMTPLVIIGMIASAAFDNSSAPPTNTGMVILSVLFYVLAAVWFIWMGIGSIKARRWARALVLVSSWFWLICGICGLVFMLLLMPDIYGRMADSGQMPPEVVAVMKYVTIGFMAVLYVIIPGALVLFYGRKDVKATCEFRDSQIRWTDKCPLPVLAMSLMFGFWAVSMLSVGASRWTIPFFGFILSGITGAVIALAVMLLFGYVAWGFYKLSIKAWRCAVLLIIVWALSVVITFSRVSMMDFYERMNLPEQQLEIIKQYDVLWGPTMVLCFGLWFVGLLLYLLYTKRYFAPTSAQESPSHLPDPNS